MAEGRNPKRDPQPGDTAVSDGVAWVVARVDGDQIHLENLRRRKQTVSLREWSEMKQHTAIPERTR